MPGGFRRWCRRPSCIKPPPLTPPRNGEGNFEVGLTVLLSSGSILADDLFGVARQGQALERVEAFGLMELGVFKIGAGDVGVT